DTSPATHVHTIILFFSSSAVPGALRSFPTRRSSDLLPGVHHSRGAGHDAAGGPALVHPGNSAGAIKSSFLPGAGRSGLRAAYSRSEEHTSELQSRFDLVCRLLLEKKNNVLK